MPATAAISFTLATPEQDAVIRRLLRDTPTRGSIDLTFEREPDYFHGANVMGGVSQTVLGWRDQQLIGVGRCTARRGYLNGQVRRIGYLSELRLVTEVQGRFDIIRRGYRFFQELHTADPADFYFTSIAVDNTRSLRLLERNLRGMPAYRPLADFTTLLIPVPMKQHFIDTRRELATQGLMLMTGNEVPATRLISFLDQHAQASQLAPRWREEDLVSLKSHGLSGADFQLIVDRVGTIQACAALWDQRGFKQTVVRGYHSGMAMVRPLINGFGNIFGTTTLPAVGEPLGIGFIFASHVNDLQHLPVLIKSLLPLAARKGLSFLSWGLAATDPRLNVMRTHFRSRVYRTRLYQVAWEKSEPLVLDNRPLAPEVALL